MLYFNSKPLKFNAHLSKKYSSIKSSLYKKPEPKLPVYSPYFNRKIIPGTYLVKTGLVISIDGEEFPVRDIHLVS